jgi:hypothetical protein
MDILNLQPFYEFLALPDSQKVWIIIMHYGWMVLAIIYLWGAKELWLSYIRRKWAATQKFILLAIDIPKANEQTPKAVENIFSYLAGAHGTQNLIEKYWNGDFQLSFSLEIVSIEGYTQFLIRTPAQFRNLVESAIYSQYPDAEIIEVDDYTTGIPKTYPNDTHDVWGAEFILKSKDVYPIKTYKNFENTIGEKDTLFKDPMATLMDLYSSLGKGEQIWQQIIIIPTGFDWVDKGEAEINKILGVKSKATFANRIIDSIVGVFSAISDQIYSTGAVEEKKAEDSKIDMMNLKPKQKIQIEAIDEKVSKLGYLVKIRVVYVAKKEVLNKAKVANGIVGYMKQFAALNLNNLKPDMDKTATKAAYFYAEKRLNEKKNRIVRNYISRDDTAGRTPFILNIEELATIWHFPLEGVVKAPLIQKAPGRKSEPPMSLPIGDEIVGEDFSEPIFEDEISDLEEKISNEDIFEEEDVFKDKEDDEKPSPPSNLPFA